LKDIVGFKLRRDTYCWICPKEDRLICVFAFEFPIKADFIIANQILTEFTEVRRARDFQSAPGINYSKDPPLELKGIQEPSYNRDAFFGIFFCVIITKSCSKCKIRISC